MADLDLERAKRLFKSATALYERGDLAGVAGLAYAAFESAIIALTTKRNGLDYSSHSLRRQRAKVLLENYRDTIDVLWEVRNIDFYGNVKIGYGVNPANFRAKNWKLVCVLWSRS